MKKSILFILLISMPLLIFSQEMFKAKNTSKTSFGAETSTSKMSKGNTMTSRSGSGTVNGSIVADLSVTATGGVNYTVPINA